MLKTLTGILSAAGLAVCLGLILNCDDKNAKKTENDTETNSGRPEELLGRATP